MQDKEDPSRKHGRVDSWKKGHERRDGTILESARIHYVSSKKRRLILLIYITTHIIG